MLSYFHKRIRQQVGGDRGVTVKPNFGTSEPLLRSRTLRKESILPNSLTSIPGSGHIPYIIRWVRGHIIHILNRHVHVHYMPNWFIGIHHYDGSLDGEDPGLANQFHRHLLCWRRG